MAGFKFYNPLGNEITKEEFISSYSPCYFNSVNPVVEEAIMKLMGKQRYTEQEVFDILAWKIGAIKQNPYNTPEFEYNKNWNKNSLDAFSRGYKIDVSDITEKLNEINEPTVDSFIEKIAKVQITYIDEKGEINTRNFGCVYAITLLFFRTNKNEPIYDSFVSKAMQAIINDIKPWGEYISAKSTDPGGFSNVYNEYKAFLQNCFEDSWTSRDVDRALWVYGHMFPEK